MYPTKCRCGHHTLNFKKNIGPFFVDECCTKAGYDSAGNLVEEEPKDPPPAPVETKSERKAREKAEREAAAAASKAEQDANSQDT